MTSNSEAVLQGAESGERQQTSLRRGTIGVLGIMFFVFSAQAPLTGIAGATSLAFGLGSGAGAPGAYVLVGLIILVFAVGFVAMSRKVDTHGGFYAYVSAALGRPMGGGAASLAVLTYVSVQAGMYGLYGASFSALLASLGIEIPWWLIVLATVALVHFMGTRNIEFGTRVLAALVGLELMIALAFGLKVLYNGGGPEGLNFMGSFAPDVVAAGAPGVAIVFAVASMYGFESTAIYSTEAKDPRRTVARATYFSVFAITVFFAFMTWMITSYYGASEVQGAALTALGSGDSTSFVFNALVNTLGPWAGLVGQVLLLTSLLAGVMALHNSVNRYFHSLALHGTLPAALAQTNRHLAPSAAALVQSSVTLLLVAPFAILGLDPVLTLFSWGGGVSVAALLLVYSLTSLAVIVYFRRNRQERRVWQTILAPSLALILLVGLLALVFENFSQLTGEGQGTTVGVLLAIVPLCFVLGVSLEVLQARSSRRKAVGND